MRIRTFAVACVVSVVATLPLAGVASAQPERDCPDFATQADAQAALNSVPGDPERLDADDDGIACESRFGGGSASTADATQAQEQVRTVPQGGVDTGDGSATDSGPLVVVLLGASALGAGALAVRRPARQSR